MARGKIHYRDTFNRDMSLCGNYPNPSNITGTQRHVTCIKCRKALGLPVETKPKVPKPAPTFDFEVTDDVKKALKYVGKTMGAWAERTNQCNTYDMAITYLNTKMPEGVKVPGRYADWKIKIENKDGEVMHLTINAATSRQALENVKYQAARVSGGLEKATFTVIGEVE